MKKLTATLCLTLAVLLGSAGISASADFKNASTAEKAIQCSSLYLIATSLSGTDKQAGKAFMSLQRLFESLYSHNEENRYKRTITIGMVSKVKSAFAEKIGEAYDRDPNTVYGLEMRCNAWRKMLHQYMKLKTINNKSDLFSAVMGAPKMPDTPSPSDPRWPSSIRFVDSSFDAWTKLGRITPSSIKEMIKRKLKK